MVLIIDTLQPLAASSPTDLPAFLSSLLVPSNPALSIQLIAVYHTDVPYSALQSQSYAPSPLTLLRYLATTILTLHSFSQVLARKRAAEKSLAEPLFGLAEEREGVLVGVGANDPRGVVIEMEARRKSGRGVEEWFFLPAAAPADAGGGSDPVGKVMLLDDHPLYNRRGAATDAGKEGKDDDVAAGEPSTFDLGLTAKQRKDREAVVLPYFDAQAGEGGMGGRILYDMGVEDDFDEEEDEI